MEHVIRTEGMRISKKLFNSLKAVLDNVVKKAIVNTTDSSSNSRVCL